MPHLPKDDLEARYLDELQSDPIGTSELLAEGQLDDAVMETADGCLVEPDGVCPHGYSSPLLLLGVI